MVNKTVSDKLFYGVPEKNDSTIFDTHDFETFFNKTTLYKDYTVFKHRPYAYRYKNKSVEVGKKEKIFKENFREYRVDIQVRGALSNLIKTLTDSSLRELLSTADYVELCKDIRCGEFSFTDEETK